MKRVLLVVVATLVVASALLAGCRSIKVGYKGSNRTGHMSATYHQFLGDESRAVAMKQDQVLHLEYALHSEQGELTVRVLGPDGDAVWTTTAEHGDGGRVDLRAKETGDYRVIAVGNDTRGSFDLTWRVE